MNNLFIKNEIEIPDNELEITASRSGGPGGQHVNKTNSRITLRWNVKNSNSLNDERKQLLIQKLHSILTSDSDLIININVSRSQQQNKKIAIENFIQILRKAFHTPKKRIKTKPSTKIKEKRLSEKTQRSKIKKLRNKIFD